MSKRQFIKTPSAKIPPEGCAIITDGYVRSSDWVWDRNTAGWGHPNKSDYDRIGTNVYDYAAVARKIIPAKQYNNLPDLQAVTEVRGYVLQEGNIIKRHDPFKVCPDDIYHKVILKNQRLYNYFYLFTSEGWKVWARYSTPIDKTIVGHNWKDKHKDLVLGDND